ncbi:MAG: AraC family transcriptional regulator ligand-binding domain-containing protein, partial [Oceanococcaceae bacterium]
MTDSNLRQSLSAFTVSTHFVRLLTEYAAASGLVVSPWLQANGVDPATLDDPDGRIAFADYDVLLNDLAAQLTEPHIGLRLGQTARLAHLGTSGLAQMACSTVQELLPRMARYNSLIMDAFEDDLEVVGNELILHWRRRIPDPV